MAAGRIQASRAAVRGRWGELRRLSRSAPKPREGGASFEWKPRPRPSGPGGRPRWRQPLCHCFQLDPRHGVRELSAHLSQFTVPGEKGAQTEAGPQRMGLHLVSEQMNECKALVPTSALFIAVCFLPAP